MIDFVIPLIVLAVLACLASARLGIRVSLVVGFVMDPIRKVYPEQPVWMSGVVAACIAATFLGAWLRDEATPLRDLRERYRHLVFPLLVCLVWVVVELARGYVLTASAAVAAIGLLAYAVPVLAFFVGFSILDRRGDLERLTKFHIVATALMLGAALVAGTSAQNKWLEQVGEGIHVHAYGRTVAARGGLFRGLEMAGWHAVAGLSMVVVLALAAWRRSAFWFLAASAPLLAYGLVAAARRKYVVQFVVFLAIWGALGWLFRRSRQAGAWAALLVLIVAVLVATLQVGVARADRESESAGVRRLERLNTDTAGRFQYFAFTALGAVYERNGFLGSGAGTGSQGAQYFGAGTRRLTGFQAEGGFGKVLAELGVPGLVLMAWLAFAAVRCVLSAIAGTHALDEEMTDVATGVSAFLLSNVAVFAIAHQVFGDPFVLTMLGLFAGGLLRLPTTRSEDDSATPPVGDAARDDVGSVA